MRRLNRTAIVCAVLLSGCGGGGGTSSVAPVAISNPTGSNAAAFRLADGTSFTLPSAGGVTGRITFAAAGGAQNATIAATASASGTLSTSGASRATTGAATVYYVLSLTSSVDLTFPTVPSIALALPSSVATGNRAFSYAVSDAAATSANGVTTYRTEGPGTVAGSAVTFAASSVPFTLPAGQTAQFIFYSTGVASTTSGIYVGRRGAIDVFATSAVTDAAPMRELAVSPPPPSFLSLPNAVAHDAAGRIVSFDGTSLIIFAAGAASGAAPVLTLPVGAPAGVAFHVTQLAVSATGEVALYGNQQTYNAPGSGIYRYRLDAAPPAAPIGFIPSSVVPSEMTYDADGNLIVGFAGYGATVATYPPGATSASRSFAVPPQFPDQQEVPAGIVAGAATIDVLVEHVAVSDQNEYPLSWDVRRYPASAAGTATPQFSFPVADAASFNALAEDAAGTFYVLGTNSVRVFAGSAANIGTPAGQIAGPDTRLASPLGGITVVP